MNSRSSVSWKVASVILAVCLALGVMIGLVIPKEQAKYEAAENDNLLRGTMDRRLTGSNDVPAEVDEEVRVEELLPAAEHVDPSTLVWPGESKAFTRGTGLWGSDEDPLETKGDMWAGYEFGEVLPHGLVGLDELSYEFPPYTSGFSYMLPSDGTYEKAQKWDMERMKQFRSETGFADDSYLSFPWPSAAGFSYDY